MLSQVLTLYNLLMPATSIIQNLIFFKIWLEVINVSALERLNFLFRFLHRVAILER